MLLVNLGLVSIVDVSIQLSTDWSRGKGATEGMFTSLCSSGSSWNSVGFRNTFTLVSRNSRYIMGIMAARAIITLIHPGMPDSC